MSPVDNEPNACVQKFTRGIVVDNSETLNDNFMGHRRRSLRDSAQKV